MFSNAKDPDQRCGYSFEVDWWAFGIILHEMLTGEPLLDATFDDITLEHVKAKQMNKIYLSVIENTVGDHAAADLIYRLNEKEPHLRIGM